MRSGLDHARLPRDIVKLAFNEHGRDIIIADLHGNNGCLGGVINTLGLRQNDRLFIAGDLVDRGEDSLGVIDAILSCDVPVYCVRGNHEEMAIRTIQGLQCIVADLAAGAGRDFVLSREMIMTGIKAQPNEDLIHQELLIHIHWQNGGMWLVDLFVSEFNRQFIVFDEAKNDCSYSEFSKISQIFSFFNKLPYIIQVEGSDDVVPFNVVHADMPISDLELSYRIESGKGLTEEEKYYAVWAREADFDDDIGRGVMSVVSYCGHTIIGRSARDFLRSGTSTINLDLAAYSSNISLAMNHTRQAVEVITAPGKWVSKGDAIKAAEVAREVGKYMSHRYAIRPVADMVKECITQVIGSPVETVVRVYGDCLQHINDKIRELSGESYFPEFEVDELLFYIHMDLNVSDELLKAFNLRMVEGAIALAKLDAPLTRLRRIELDMSLNEMAALYNMSRCPEVLVDYSGLIQQVDACLGGAKGALFELDGDVGRASSVTLDDDIEEVERYTNRLML